MRFHIQID